MKFHPLANLSSWIESNRAPDPAAAAATAPEAAPDDAASGALDADERWPVCRLWPTNSGRTTRR